MSQALVGSSPFITALTAVLMILMHAPLRAADPRVLVAARHTEDISWLHELNTQDLVPLVYTMHGPNGMLGGLQHRRPNGTQGKEANAYLTYIIEHWESLPEAAVFIHAHREGWHLWHKPQLLDRLNWALVQEHGFVSLRYRQMPCTMFDCSTAGTGGSARDTPYWSDGMRIWLHNVTETPDELSGLVQAAAREQRMFALPGCSVYTISFDKLLAHFWATASPTILQELGPMPRWVQSPCCGEFAVTRTAIRCHSLAFYKDLLAYVESFPACQISFIIEFLWAYFFTRGQETVLPFPACELYDCRGASDLVADLFASPSS